MLRPRPYRERFKAREALVSLYADNNGRYDPALLALLIRDVGHYPPGSVVRLANREIAVATRALAESPSAPLTASIADSHGRPLVRPFLRETRGEEVAITETLDPSFAGRASRTLEQCWTWSPLMESPIATKSEAEMPVISAPE
jgi:hypothetical protein